MNETTKRDYPNYLVKDEVLLYKIADAGLLDKLSRVAKDKFDETKRIWFFDKDQDVKQIIDDYWTKKKSEKEDDYE